MVLQSVASVATRTLTPPHRSPVDQGPMVQTADGNSVVLAFGISICAIPPYWGFATLRAQHNQ